MEKWKNSVAIVTGGNSGMGLSILKKLAESGVTVVGLDIAIDEVNKFKDENLNLNVHAILCDITKNDDTEAAFEWVDEKLGGVDILVNSAGTLKLIGLLEHQKPMADLAHIVDLNFTALVRCSRLAFKSMESRDAYGYIININSSYGHALPPMPDRINIGVYPSTKYAVTAAAEIMRNELISLENRKVRITSLSPGVVKTNIFAAAGYSDEHREAFLAQPHLLPEDISETVAFLLTVPYHVSIHELMVRATGSHF